MHPLLGLVLFVLPYFIESQIIFTTTGLKTHHSQVTLSDQKTIVISSSFISPAYRIDIIGCDPDDYLNESYYLGVKTKETRDVHPNRGNVAIYANKDGIYHLGGTVWPFSYMTSQVFEAFPILPNGSISTANYTVHSLSSSSGMTPLTQTRIKVAGFPENSTFFAVGQQTDDNSMATDGEGVAGIHYFLKGNGTQSTLMHSGQNLTGGVGRNFITSIRIGNYLLFAGGSINNYINGSVNYTDVYHGPTNTWSNVPMNMKRTRMQAVAVGQYAVFIGGYDSTGVQSDKIHIFDSSTGTWLPDRTLNTVKCKCRYEHAMVYVGGVIYIAGGRDGNLGHAHLGDICYIKVTNWTNWVYMNSTDYYREKWVSGLKIRHYWGGPFYKLASMAGSAVIGENCSFAVFTGGIYGKYADSTANRTNIIVMIPSDEGWPNGNCSVYWNGFLNPMKRREWIEKDRKRRENSGFLNTERDSDMRYVD